MGGCATKPKVLKDAPAPEPTKEDKPSAAPEPPVVVVVGVTEGEKIDAKAVEEGDNKAKEIVDDDKLDDQDSKRRSLSILFKEVSNHYIFFFVRYIADLSYLINILFELLIRFWKCFWPEMEDRATNRSVHHVFVFLHLQSCLLYVSLIRGYFVFKKLKSLCSSSLRSRFFH